MQNAFSIPKSEGLTQLLRVMRISTLIILIVATHLSAKTVSQTISLTGTKIPFTKIAFEIKLQTGFAMVYNPEIIAKVALVTIDVRNTPLREFLDKIATNQPFGFLIEGNTIFIIPRPLIKGLNLPLSSASPPITVRGKIVNENGEPLIVNVILKGTGRGVTTNSNGAFELDGVEEEGVLIISATNIETREIKIKDHRDLQTIVVKTKISPLDEVQLIAYGSTTKRLNTGNVSTITARQIESAPVSNVLAAIQGLAPGLSVIQNDGLPGGGFSVNIRGYTSLRRSSAPLILVDGAPFSNSSTGSFPGTALENSPLNTLNPGDIERLDVLKDADATAIYGSRGANGVILITTKKGKPGKTSFELNSYAGFSSATHLMSLLNTPQYLQMRREAFKNDSLEPTALNAPDLLLWDTTRYTDWQKLLLGGRSRTQDVQASLTGGNGNTSFRISPAFHHETPLYADNPYIRKRFGYVRGSIAVNVTHRSVDGRFNIFFNSRYSADRSNYTAGSLSVIPISPNAPVPIDKNGALNWSEAGATFDNPFAALKSSYDGNNHTLIYSSSISYRLYKGFTLKSDFALNEQDNDYVSAMPKAAQNPVNNPVSYAQLSSLKRSSWIIEPQLTYETKRKNVSFSALLGTTLQDQSEKSMFSTGYDYSSDLFLGTLAGAAYTSTAIKSNKYRYVGVYGRLTLSTKDRYFLDLNGRRDGSSRFGPGQQYGNFGSVGAAWIFTQEKWAESLARVISFGKIRGSYGATGSDNIGDYQYVDSWYSQQGYSYGGTTSLVPNNLLNPDFRWELNLKSELGLELGFFKDRILVTASLYRHRSGNQLISYSLPSQTGFTSILRNFPATVQNNGVEFNINSTNIRTTLVQWTSSFNISANGNKLVAFPGLESSSYGSQYIIGQPITIGRFFQYLGVNSLTGLYSFAGTDFSKDRSVIKNANGSPKFFGGMENRVRVGQWELSFLLTFVSAFGQTAQSRLADYGAPGSMYNQPIQVLDRWQAKGDRANVQRFTTQGEGYDAFYNYVKYSDASVVDASFIRLKNLSLSYNFNSSMINKVKFQSCRLYLECQNLAVLTSYQGADPESQGLGNPLFRSVTAGLQVKF